MVLECRTPPPEYAELAYSKTLARYMREMPEDAHFICCSDSGRAGGELKRSIDARARRESIAIDT